MRNRMPVTKQHTGRVVAAPARCKRYNIPDSELKGFGLRVEPRGAAIRKKNNIAHTGKKKDTSESVWGEETEALALTVRHDAVTRCVE